VSGAYGDDADAARMQYFETHVRPVLASNCVSCHGPDKQKGNLRLDSHTAMLEGGSRGAAILPGNVSESLLIQAVRHADLEMPPTGPLLEEQIAVLEQWIDAGAFWPEHDAPILPVSDVKTDHSDWWAVQPLTRPEVPAAPDDAWSRNPVDRFVYARMAEAGITTAPEASRAVLARRLYYDVIGLPPTPEELSAFLQDTSDDAWARLVDRLLDDPRYGEHWARFWLDLVRYAESDGWNKDSYRPHIWRYRDYVVRAFNADKPYPEFVREQLAGDELPQDDADHIIATGFLRLGIYEYNQRDARGQWNDIMNEITDVTGDAFLGVSMSCSRCHDHKFDPIPQSDYYSLRAFFEPLIWTDKVPGATAAEVAEHRDQQAVWEAKTATIRGEIEALCAPYYAKKWASTVDKFPLEIQACFYKPVSERNSWEHQMAYLVERQFHEEGQPALKGMSEEDKKKLEALEQELSAFDDIKPKPLPTVMSVRDFTREVSPTLIPRSREKDPVPPGFLSVLAAASDDPETLMPESVDSTGRRTALAKWIGNENNPLTTRVIVNRIWQQHFGEGIVPSSSDFGQLGQPPTHPALLDWLTREFIKSGWSMKHLHRLILNAAVWRQSSVHPRAEENLEKDPAEKLLWRFDTRRLKAEELRDAMLVAAGELQDQVGGPSVKGDTPRRSLYLQTKRNSPDTLLQAFDATNGLTSVAKRNETTTPIQALNLFNGDYVVGRAKKMAEAILADVETPDAAIALAFQRAWSRQPTDEERAGATALVQASSEGVEPERLADLCHVLLNSNGFLYVD
jgi:hypothetical protein